MASVRCEVEFPARKARAICTECGGELLESDDGDGRYCETHGLRVRYRVVAGGGNEYDADGKMGPALYGREVGHASPIAIKLLMEGHNIKAVQFHTGISRSTLYRWQEEIRRGER